MPTERSKPPAKRAATKRAPARPRLRAAPAGMVAKATQEFLEKSFSPHPAAELLGTLAKRLAAEVDEGPAARDLVSLSTELRALATELTKDLGAEEDDDDVFGGLSVPS